MAIEIKTWEIINGQLIEIKTSMTEHDRREKDDLEQWIKSEQSILGTDIKIIGEQVRTASGPLDYLGIDDKGNLVIIELKRDRLPREALAQAIDYASDVAKWEIDTISEVCLNYTGQSIEDFISENFEEVDRENITINQIQRITLVGFAIESSLSRMIEWLSRQYDMAINAIALKYIKTSSGNELLSRTAIIPEDIEKDKISKKSYKIEMSDEPGDYNVDDLRELMKKYLTMKLWSSRRIRHIMIPYLLKMNRNVTRIELKKEFLRVGGDLGGSDTQQAGIFIALISNQLGQKRKDYLRQVLQYDYPSYDWEKDNFRINPQFREMMSQLLDEINNDENPLQV